MENLLIYRRKCNKNKTVIDSHLVEETSHIYLNFSINAQREPHSHRVLCSLFQFSKHRNE